MSLLAPDDPKWAEYRGGYRRPVSGLAPFLEKLLSLEVQEDDWNVLWDDLHHQGDVGEASYAVVPYLAEYAKSAPRIAWHAFWFPAIVELERTEHGNPEVPDEIRESYFASLQALPEIALTRGTNVWDEYCFEPVMTCLALSLGRREHARVYSELTDSVIQELFSYYYGDDDR